MRVKAIVKYHDTVLKRDMKPQEEFEVETEERLKELQGNNKYNLVCVEVIAEEVKEDTTSSPEEITKSSPEDTAKGKTKNAKRK